MDQPIEGRRWAFMSMEACAFVRADYELIGCMAARAVLAVVGLNILTIGSDPVFLSSIEWHNDNGVLH